MKPSKSFLLACMIMTISTCVSVMAATTDKRLTNPAIQNGINPAPRATQKPAAGAITPLKGDMHISPGAFKNVAGTQAMQLHFDKIDQKYKELSGNAQYYEAGTQMLPNIQKSCMEQSYSAQDQAAAGCTGNDTVTQCSDKLFKYCVSTFSAGGMNFPSPLPGQSGAQIPGVSTKQFKDSAILTASQAKALAQQLNQYANQAEQFAKSF